MTFEEIKDIVTSVPNNSVVIIQCPDSDVENVSNSLKMFNDMLLNHKISMIICPLEYKLTVVPPGSNIEETI